MSTPETTGGAGPEPTARFRTGAVAAIASAHFVHDVFTSFLPPLLPLLIEKLDLRLVLAGTLAVVIQLPSLANPWLGSWADRRGMHRGMVVAGVAGTGVLMCLIGLAPGLPSLTVLLLAAGASVAILHVAGPALVHRFSGPSIGRGMSFFMLGGETARTVGPLVAVWAVSVFTLEGLWRLVPVPLVYAAFLARVVGREPAASAGSPPAGAFRLWARIRGLLLAVVGVLMARAFLVVGLGIFLPTYFYGRGGTLWTANLALAVFEAGGAAGALTAGTLSDRIGRRRVLLAAVALAPPLMLAFLAVPGPARFVVLFALGFVALATSPVLMALVIESSGADRAAASGTYFTLAFTVRSLTLPIVGALGDAIGLHAAFAVCAVLAALGLPFAWKLPRGSAVRHSRPAP